MGPIELLAVTADRGELSPDERPPATDAPALVRRLLDHCAPDRPAPGALRPGSTVVLGVQLDGVEYQLVRAGPEPSVGLSSRELEIARMISRGHTNRTMAAVLEISPWTVSTHVRRIYAKLDVGSRAAMVARLDREGVDIDAGTGRGA